MHLIIKFCCLFLFQFYSQGGVNFCPSVFLCLKYKQRFTVQKLCKITGIFSIPSFWTWKKSCSSNSTPMPGSFAQPLELQHDCFTTSNQPVAFLGMWKHVCCSVTWWVPLVLKFMLFELAGSCRQLLEQCVPIISSPELGRFLRKNGVQKVVALQQKSKTGCPVVPPAVAGEKSLQSVVLDALVERWVTATCLLWMLGLSSPAT